MLEGVGHTQLDGAVVSICTADAHWGGKAPNISVGGGGGWMDTADFTCSSSLSCEAFHPKGTFCLQWGPSATGPAAMSQTL